MSDFGNFTSGDPTEDFLARERAALGGDLPFLMGDAPLSSTSAAVTADLSAFPPIDAFDTPAAAASTFTGGATVGGADPFGAMPTASAPPSMDMFGGGGGASAASPALFEATGMSMPSAIPLPGSPAPSYPAESPITGYSANAIPEAESEHIIRWREDFQAAIAARDATEARAKADAIARAKEEIDKFYEGYNTKRDKALAESKVLQEKMLADLNDAQSGTFWERVVKQVEVVGGGSNKIDDSAAKKKAAAAAANANGTAADKDKAGDGSGKSKDVTRFKQVLLALKADKNNAPGA